METPTFQEVCMGLLQLMTSAHDALCHPAARKLRHSWQCGPIRIEYDPWRFTAANDGTVKDKPKQPAP